MSPATENYSRITGRISFKTEVFNKKNGHPKRMATVYFYCLGLINLRSHQMLRFQVEHPSRHTF